MSSNLEDSKPLELTPQADSEEMVRIPADTLSSILSRLSALESQRDEVLTLQGKLSTVSAELSKLQKNTGVSFPRFSELPAELRNMIWRYALTGLPQIHILGNEICTRSMVNAVAQSCKEAQEVLEDLELDYLLIDGQISSGPGMVTADSFRYRSYVNLDIDTFWLNNDLDHERKLEVHIPFTVTPVCGKCVKKSGPVTRGSPDFGKGTICPRIASRYFFPMRTMAINADLWTEKDDMYYTGTLELLWRCKVEKLLIVVGHTLCFSPHMVFATPNTQFAANWEKKFLGANSQGHGGHGAWFTLEENIQIAMQNFKDQRAVDRKEECESLGIELEDLDDYEYDHMCDLSDWEIPTVTFVSARPGSREWVIPSTGF